MSYTRPQDVTAPQEHWTLHSVLISGEAGTTAYALGTWTWADETERCIGTRWNGTDDNETGWPRIFVHPCWHIIDRKLHDAVIALLPDYKDKIYAMRFLAGEDI
jgi:hypothetical protein